MSSIIPLGPIAIPTSVDEQLSVLLLYWNNDILYAYKIYESQYVFVPVVEIIEDKLVVYENIVETMVMFNMLGMLGSIRFFETDSDGTMGIDASLSPDISLAFRGSPKILSISQSSYTNWGESNILSAVPYSFSLTQSNIVFNVLQTPLFIVVPTILSPLIIPTSFFTSCNPTDGTSVHIININDVLVSAYIVQLVQVVVKKKNVNHYVMTYILAHSIQIYKTMNVKIHNQILHGMKDGMLL